MPWRLGRRGEDWVVVSKKSGKIKGTHKTRDAAVNQLRALYVNVPEASVKKHLVSLQEGTEMSDKDLEKGGVDEIYFNDEEWAAADAWTEEMPALLAKIRAEGKDASLTKALIFYKSRIVKNYMFDKPDIPVVSDTSEAHHSDTGRLTEAELAKRPKDPRGRHVGYSPDADAEPVVIDKRTVKSKLPVIILTEEDENWLSIARKARAAKEKLPVLVLSEEDENWMALKKDSHRESELKIHDQIARELAEEAGQIPSESLGGESEEKSNQIVQKAFARKSRR